MDYAYIGPEEGITLRGVDFPQGEAVDLSAKPGLAAKVGALPYFERVEPEDSEDAIKADLIAQLEQAGVDVDGRWGLDKLRKKLAETEVAQ